MDIKKNHIKIGFIGQGWIGKHYADNFEDRGYKVVRYSLEEPHVHNGDRIKDCDIVFIAVPTPSTPQGFDVSILKNAIKKVGEGKIAVIKSTLLLGMTEEIQKENPGVFIFHSPEFLSEATAALDAANPKRNIVGTPIDTPDYIIRAKFVLSVLPRANFEIICKSNEAELIKYGGNNWFYLKVVYINMLYDLAIKGNASWDVIREAMSNDPRIGPSHMIPVHKSGTAGGDAFQTQVENTGEGGRGAGGHCFIKDFAAFIEMYKKYVGDENGVKALKSIEDKNLDLLIKSGKDFDLLRGVYGERVREATKNYHAEKNNKPKNILITGGAGFIGFHTAIKLLKRGDNVVVIDNFNSYYDPRLKRSRAEILQEKFKNVKIIELDIADHASLKKVFENYRFDKILNLAAQAGVRYSLVNPFIYQQTNVQGFLNILELAKEFGIKDIVFASSSSVYGNCKELPFSETARVDTPISLYAATKKSNEESAYVYSHLFGMNMTGLRFFTVYGPWGRPDMALFKFVKKTLKGEPIDVYNNGEMSRDFTYVDDIANGVVAAIDNPFRFEIINLARGKSVKLMDYIGEIEKNLGLQTIKNMMPMQPGDVPETSADISKAERLLNYLPKVSVDEGVKRFIDWYQKYYQK